MTGITALIFIMLGIYGKKNCKKKNIAISIGLIVNVIIKKMLIST